MTEQERVEVLLGRGYLPKELPPPFQSHTFSGKAVELKAAFSAYLAGLSKKKGMHTHCHRSQFILIWLAGDIRVELYPFQIQ
ncbi:hypothetical protein [Burkholderia multivorans]|uniref:hypothetical protein n=1 Tax=Burkholderia multivorans TaxID=87883 RepID=UPI001C26F30C|nr:hypothetical protein [Burkholderia multivorans]MBU9326593.1 hypothetical protein [Burkholderia multivorans]